MFVQKKKKQFFFAKWIKINLICKHTQKEEEEGARAEVNRQQQTKIIFSMEMNGKTNEEWKKSIKF